MMRRTIAVILLLTGATAVPASHMLFNDTFAGFELGGKWQPTEWDGTSGAPDGMELVTSPSQGKQPVLRLAVTNEAHAWRGIQTTVPILSPSNTSITIEVRIRPSSTLELALVGATKRFVRVATSESWSDRYADSAGNLDQTGRWYLERAAEQNGGWRTWIITLDEERVTWQIRGRIGTPLYRMRYEGLNLADFGDRLDVVLRLNKSGPASASADVERITVTAQATRDEAVAPPAPPPLPWVPGSFTLVVLPDTQMYAEVWPEHFHNMTRWIATNVTAHNIAYVLHEGDIVNRDSREQAWSARLAMARLDVHVPYALAPGNHDQQLGTERASWISQFFDIRDVQAWPTFGGTMEPWRLENTWHTFRVGETDFLILALEWAPRDKTVAWANRMVDAHPQHRVILLTHAYMYDDDTRLDWKAKGNTQGANPHHYAGPDPYPPEGINDGEELWQKLVSKHAQFMMVFSGHIIGDGIGRLTSRGDHGNAVHQMLFNCQGQKEGGEGFLRLIEFLPDGKTVQVKTYSPSLGAYRTDDQNQFLLELDPPLPAR